MWTWGRENNEENYEPKIVKGINNFMIEEIAVGAHHFGILGKFDKEESQVLTWFFFFFFFFFLFLFFSFFFYFFFKLINTIKEIILLTIRIRDTNQEKLQ